MIKYKVDLLQLKIKKKEHIMRKILLSTDIGSDIDDALTLLSLLNHPEVDLGGIYVVNGDVVSRGFIAKKMVTLLNRDIPVVIGTANPLGAEVSPYKFFEDILVSDEYFDEERMNEDGNVHYQPTEDVGILSGAVEHMALKIEEGYSTILSIGPMTDIALLLREYPEIHKKIEKICIMGFRGSGVMEHNVRYDYLAAQEVVDSDVSLLIVPGDLCNKYALPFEQFVNMNTKTGIYVLSMLKAFVGAKTVQNLRELNIYNLENDIRAIFPFTLLEREDPNLHWRLHLFLVNFDGFMAYYERDHFLGDYFLLIEVLNGKFGNDASRLLANKLQAAVHKSISMSDVCAAYCLLHFDKIKMEKRDCICAYNGASWLPIGSRADVVVDMDSNHFCKFVTAYVR
jgi:inosine-uridine nucleoside N-ribohydrolase